MTRKRGDSPRPRAGLIALSVDEQTAFARLFPTVWVAASSNALQNRVSPAEIDVVVSRYDLGVFWSSAHCIVLSPTNQLGLLDGALLGVVAASSAGYTLPEVDPVLSSLQTAAADAMPTARGRPVIVGNEFPSLGEAERANNILREGAVVLADQPRAPIGTIVLRPRDGLESPVGFAWVPNLGDSVDWVRAILYVWARHDPERLPPGVQPPAGLTPYRGTAGSLTAWLD